MNLSQQSSIENRILLTDIQYFGTIHWHYLLNQFQRVQLESHETFQKMSFRNRCIIAGSNGIVPLSIPIEKGRNQKALIRDIKISYAEKWQQQHWRSIVSCYGNAPFFEYYEPSLIYLFQQKPNFLFDFNFQVFEWVNKNLKAKYKWEKTIVFEQFVEDDIIDIRNQILVKNYENEMTHLIYKQVFDDRIGFKPNLCILDLLFCNGPATQSILSQNFNYS